MILIFGGTTEGRVCVHVCDEAQKQYYYSTKTEHQEIELHHGIHLSGAMTTDEIVAFCKLNSILLIVDAAHPFAENLHTNIAKASKQLNIPTIRYERYFPPRDESLIWFDSYQEAISYLVTHNIDNLLALTGVNTIAKLKPYWVSHHTWFRILNRDDSKEVASQAGYPSEQLLYYHKGVDEVALLKELQPDAIITKESGESGGFEKKVKAAQSLGIPMLVVKRPTLSKQFIAVHGPYGLRKEIERLLPDFFELKIGYTTGSCATAATKAALLSLITGEKTEKVSITLPSGEMIYIPTRVILSEEGKASAVVIKDAGDDPDVTHGKEIVSTIALNADHKGVRFLQGKGVGMITLPGLDIPIGEPAINKTPRMMMKREIFKVLRHYEDLFTNGLQTGVDVTISVPEGEELAKKTFNPRLGIVGGISIIGTSGVVKPFSSAAFIGSIRREMQVAKALGCKHIVINSGAKSEKYIKKLYPDFLSNAFVHYGNFIGDAIEIAKEEGFQKLTMGIMLGKAVKLAEGNLDTHSKKVVMNKDFLKSIAQEAKCEVEVLDKIDQITMARQLWDIIPSSNQSFFHLVLEKCHTVCSPLFGNGELQIYLITDDGEILE